MKEKNTLEKLAQMVGKGFNQMDEGFGRVEERLDRFDRRFIDVELRLDNIKTDIKDIQLNRLEFAYAFEAKSLEKRVERLEERE